MVSKTILRIGWLLSGVMVWTGGICFAQTHDPPLQIAQEGPSTSDLEGQPNTNNYPRNHRPVQLPNPSGSNSGFQPPAPSNQRGPAFSTTAGNGVNPGQANAAPVNPHSPGAQNQPLIGPPAPPTPTLEEQAPAPPKVSYENGLLSVESVNARLSDVLAAIRVKAGIRFEGSTAGSDRVAGKFGPAPADAVLTSLLQGSRFDYVIIGTPDNPSQVEKVILSPNLGPTSTAATTNQGARPVQQANSDDDDDSDDSSEASQPVPVAPQQGVQAQPAQPRSDATTTTEQLVEELKRLQRNQQGRQQQNQQVPPQNPQ